MNIEIAVLADCANVASGDKLNIMGVFDRIFAPQFPAVHPLMVLVLRLRLEFGDGDRTHALVVTMRDEDSREFFRAESKVKVPHIKPGTSAHVNQLLNFAGLGFSKPNQYFFHLAWNENEIGTVTLGVEQAGPERPT